ncbi:unnamed protein product, partial [Polarella glacialis]
APVAVDSFDHHQPGLIFFCSHAHEDHLVGLGGRWSRGPIFCSPITAKLLLLRWPTLKVLRPLAVGPVHRLPLGHPGPCGCCSGFVIFLFGGV